jgi:hypothetical protein
MLDCSELCSLLHSEDHELSCDDHELSCEDDCSLLCSELCQLDCSELHSDDHDDISLDALLLDDDGPQAYFSSTYCSTCCLSPSLNARS